MKTRAPHPISLRQLQYLVAVADAGGFRKAAELCAVSQPSLSAQVAAAEAALGVTLFERDKRRVLLTAAGEEVVGRARRAILCADDVVAAAARLGDPLRGTLRLGVIPTVAPYLLPSASPALRAAFDHLHVQWIEDKTDVLVRRLREGELEGAVLALEAELGEVEALPIARDPFLLAGAEGDALACRAGPARMAELEDAAVLLLDDGHCLRDQALEVCGTAGIRELGFRGTSLSTLAQMVAAGAGVTLLPALSVPTETARAKLVVRRFAAPEPGRTIGLVWRRHSPFDGAMRALVGPLRASYPALSDAAASP